MVVWFVGRKWHWQWVCVSVCDVSAFSLLQCNNPKTKEPKLTAAARIVPEWVEYDNEIKQLLRRAQEREDAVAPKPSTSLHKKGEQQHILCMCSAFYHTVTSLLLCNCVMEISLSPTQKRSSVMNFSVCQNHAAEEEEEEEGDHLPSSTTHIHLSISVERCQPQSEREVFSRELKSSCDCVMSTTITTNSLNERVVSKWSGKCEVWTNKSSYVALSKRSNGEPSLRA